MPRFQLLIAISLVVSAVISVLTFYLTRIKEGKIRLPSASESAVEQNEHEILDVTNGYPVDEESFWTRVC
jgi:hypothetical protein